jgi:drug/metabolite transporter (DMT)-like permease
VKARAAAAVGRRDNYPRAAALTLASALLFAAAGAMVKHVSSDLPNTMVVFFRNLFGMVLLMPWLMKRGLGALRTQHMRLHLLRAALGLGAMYCYFFAIAHLTLADAVLLNYAAPLYVPFMAALWLREPVPAMLRWAIPIGFLGVALILKPSQGLLQLSALAGLAAGGFTALSFVTLRQMSATEPAARTVFYFATLATAVSGVPLLWSWQTPDPSLWLGLLLTGFFASTGQLLLTRGYYYAPASRVGPLTYMVVVFAAALGWGFWDEIPDRWSLFGALLVCVAGVLAMRERRPVRP